jgi:hypothetical protein
MRPIFADLVAEIQRSIGFYASVHRDSRISKVISLGGTFRLPGLQKYLQQNLQLPVERLDSIGATMPTDAKLATNLNENILSAIGAYGLAVQAMGEAKIDSSLLPAAIRREKMWREKSKWFAGAAALVALGTGGVNFGSYYLNNLAYENQASVRAESQDILHKAQTLSNQWQQEVQDAGAEARTRLTNVQALLPGRRTWMKILTNLYDELPKEPPGGEKVGERGTRDYIYVDGVRSVYAADLTKALAEQPEDFIKRAADMEVKGSGMPSMDNPTFGGDLGVQQPMTPMMDDSGAPTGPPPAANAQRGFLITLKVTTPSAKGRALIQNSFLTNLTNKLALANAFPDRKFFVARTGIVKQSQINNIMARPTTPVAAAAPGQPPVIDPFIDPRTGEDIGNDTQAVLLIAVVIDPPPPPKPAPGQQASAAQP